MFNPGDSDRIIGYNPLRPNGLPPATHAKAVREAMRAAWGQESFDQTPQLARFLYLVLVAVRESGLTLADAVTLLRPGAALRQRVIAQLSDPYIRAAFEYFDSLRPQRQEEITASSLARLEAFTLDPTIRRMITAPRSLDLGEVIEQRQILLVNLELYRPLRKDDVKLLGRLIVNDAMTRVFARDARTRSPVFLLLDEVQLLATHDLCDALDLGRELGLHCVLAHQFPKQLQDEDKSGVLYDSVMNCARTKIVFGGMHVEALEPVVAELFTEQFDPWTIKDELTSLELEPIETTRESVGHAVNVGRSRGMSWGASTGQSGSATSGRSKTSGTQESSSRSTTTSEGHGANWQEGRTIQESESWQEGESEGTGWSTTLSRSSTTSSSTSSGHSLGVSSGTSEAKQTGFEGMSGPSATTTNASRTTTSTTTDTRSQAETEGNAVTDSLTFTKSRSHGGGRTRGLQRSHGGSLTHTRGKSSGTQIGTNHSKGVSRSESAGWSNATQEGESVSEQEGVTETRTTSPFYEYAKRRNVSSRTFLTKEEFLLLMLQRVKGLGRAQYVLKVPSHAPQFMRAPIVEAVRLAPRLLASGLARVFARPCYLLPSEVEDAESAAMTPDAVTPENVRHDRRKRRSPLRTLEEMLGRE